ncbi:tRNA (N6-isopentenyl adenosine(37)-C2)-methylthiotransferase MiaB, partial [Candidatus Peregrinibacteria bacterium]|nr:tRNA (N6-isopentenyl adenosine(37)-C2)-methylthiotransferase MiaB [Candidatus Peregrinibacteria bacterium]
MPKYYIQTYGCQMNYSDSERMETYLQALGYKKVEAMEDADLILFNTCSIKQKAEDKVLGQIKKLRAIKKNNPDLKVVIAGCMVRKSSSRYSETRDRLLTRVRELDIALRTEELPKLAELIREIDPNSTIEAIEEESLEDYFKIEASNSTYKSKTQAFLPVSNGCDKFCTYCIVPFSRGREKSRSLEEILRDAEELVEKGIKEITLIGQTVNSYGLGIHDQEQEIFKHLGEKEPFVHLLEELDKLKEKGLKRVRWTSPHPKDMSDQLIDAMASLETQMPYLHLPVQAGHDDTLKRMNRPYTVEQYRSVIKKLREKIPEISITTDIIVGFCDETDEEFETTYKFFEEMDFEHGYISRYSDRKGTTANRFMNDNISAKVKSERWHKVNDLLKKKSQKILEKFLGKNVNVLVEEQEGELCTGRCENYKT